MNKRGRPKKPPTRPTSIRLPLDIWELLEKSSRRNYRTMNMQIRMLIEEHLMKEGLLGGPKDNKP
tara:strand:+ start:1171 stop:1365 length:195 start_codon:yes stop_codon:yes gene_type:complete